MNPKQNLLKLWYSNNPREKASKEEEPPLDMASVRATTISPSDSLIGQLPTRATKVLLCSVEMGESMIPCEMRLAFATPCWEAFMEEPEPIKQISGGTW